MAIEEGATANISQPTLTVQAKSSTEVLLSWNSLCNPNRTNSEGQTDCEKQGRRWVLRGVFRGRRLVRLGASYLVSRLTRPSGIDFTVDPGATRYYRVSGYQEENRRQLYGRWSQVKKATTADFVVGAPQNLTITTEGERGLKLVWNEVSGGPRRFLHHRLPHRAHDRRRR